MAKKVKAGEPSVTTFAAEREEPVMLDRAGAVHPHATTTVTSGNTGNPNGNQSPSSNSPVVVVLAAPATGSGRRWALYALPYSFSAAPAAGTTLTIQYTYNSVVYTYTYYIAAGGPGFIDLRRPMIFPVETAITITLAAGGSGISGSLYPDANAELA